MQGGEGTGETPWPSRIISEVTQENAAAFLLDHGPKNDAIPLTRSHESLLGLD